MKEKEKNISSFTKWEELNQTVISLKINQPHFQNLSKKLEKEKKELEQRLKIINKDLGEYNLFF